MCAIVGYLKTWRFKMACEICSNEVQNLEFNLAKTETMWRMERLKNKMMLSLLERLATSSDTPHWIIDDVARVMKDVAQI